VPLVRVVMSIGVSGGQCGTLAGLNAQTVREKAQQTLATR
jgi:hypothetical protein